jgi:hypothetical protein
MAIWVDGLFLQLLNILRKIFIAPANRCLNQLANNKKEIIFFSKE